MLEPAQQPATQDRPPGPPFPLPSEDQDSRHRRQVSRRIALLARAIETEVVPRLVGARAAAPAPSPSEEDVERMARLVLAEDVAAAVAFAEDLGRRGIGPQEVMLGLLGPAAALLGTWWTEDRCSFVDVTLGLLHLRQVLQALSPVLLPDVAPPAEARRVLLMPAPGEQHVFGLALVGECFRRGGWDVTALAAADAAEAAEAVRQEWFAVAGLSAATEARLEPLAAVIATLRRASCNPDLAILVGGPLFRGRQDLVRRVGADGSAADGEQAVRQAESLAAAALARA